MDFAEISELLINAVIFSLFISPCMHSNPYFSLLPNEAFAHILHYCDTGRDDIRLVCKAFRDAVDSYCPMDIVLRVYGPEEYEAFETFVERFSSIPRMRLSIVLDDLDNFRNREDQRYWTLRFAAHKLPRLSVEDFVVDLEPAATSDLHSMMTTLWNSSFTYNTPFMLNLRELSGIFVTIDNLSLILYRCPRLGSLSATILEDVVAFDEHTVKLSSATLRSLFIQNERFEYEHECPYTPTFLIDLPVAEEIAILLDSGHYKPELKWINAPKLEHLIASFLLPKDAVLPSLHTLCMHEPRFLRFGYLPPSLKLLQMPPVVLPEQMIVEERFSSLLVVELGNCMFANRAGPIKWISFFYHHGVRSIVINTTSGVERQIQVIRESKWPGMIVRCDEELYF
jgi:hypothetical protein